MTSCCAVTIDVSPTRVWELSGSRPRGRLPPLAAASALLASYGFGLRPRLLPWGATSDEAMRAYPGDELVPDPDGGATMPTTLPAPPQAVWSWLVQIGGVRRPRCPGVAEARRLLWLWREVVSRAYGDAREGGAPAWERATGLGGGEEEG